MSPIDLSNLEVIAELVVIVEDLVTLRETALIYIRWQDSEGREVFESSFIVAEI